MGYEDADARLLADDEWRNRMSFYFRSARFFPTRSGTWHECEDIKAGCVLPPEEPRATALVLEVRGNGSKRTLVATLTDAESSEGLAGKDIAFFAGEVSLGTAVTNGAGQATLTPPREYRSGHHVYRAEFAGDETHVRSEASAQT